MNLRCWYPGRWHGIITLVINELRFENWWTFCRRQALPRQRRLIEYKWSHCDSNFIELFWWVQWTIRRWWIQWLGVVRQQAITSTNIDLTVGKLRSNLCTKTPIYVRSGSYIKQILLKHLSYTKHMPLEHLSYIKETSWNTSGRT